MAVSARIESSPDGSKKLVLELPINNPLPIAQSGRSYIIASSSGEETEAVVNGKKVYITKLYATIRKD